MGYVFRELVSIYIYVPLLQRWVCSIYVRRGAGGEAFIYTGIHIAGRQYSFTYVRAQIYTTHTHVRVLFMCVTGKGEGKDLQRYFYICADIHITYAHTGGWNARIFTRTHVHTHSLT